jgi:NAD(P)-dependent dehydrogenase (short-subunit alcohol dehydrogenase family)
LARKFAAEGCQVALLARSAGFSTELADDIRAQGGTAEVFPTDITDPAQVDETFGRVRERLGPVDILLNHAGNAAWGDFVDLTADDFERTWRVCAYGSFLCAQQAATDMIAAGAGAILFTGATSAIRGRAGALAFSSAKFAVRGMAWALAREFGPKGIHVAHVIIDGVLDTPSAREDVDDDDLFIATDSLANVYWSLIEQESTAWTFELDARHRAEEFFS